MTLIDKSGSHNDETSVITDKSLENDETGKDPIDWKKQYSDSSREAKRLAESDKINSSYRQVLKDPMTALDLDPKIADKVIKELFNDGFSTVETWDELKEILQEGTPKEKKEVLDEKQITEKVKQQLKDEAEENKALEIKETLLSKLDNEMRKKVEEEFSEVLGDRKITASFLEREIKKIITFYKKENGKDDEAFAKLSSNGLKGKNTTKSTNMTIDKLKSLGVKEKEMKRLYPELFNN